MAYDDLDRLTSVAAPNLWGTATYTYDSLDNIRTSTITGGATARSNTHTYDAATNRLASITSNVAAYNLGFTYDAHGNITQRGAQGFAFDQANRLKSAANKATYAYDGHGRRISVVGTAGVNRVYVYSQAGQLMYSGVAGTAGTKHIYLRNHMVAEVAPGGTQYLHTDGLGSPVARTNAARTVLSRTRYEPYGAAAAGATPAIGFTGHVNEADTGLVYMQQRYYDPIAGRFLSIDPVVADANSGGSFNRYAYANNNPYSYVDPDGRDTYRVNRDLRVFGSSARSIHNPISHTFVATTDAKGNISHTYSWGNDANPKGWNRDQPLDMKTASEALKKMISPKRSGIRNLTHSSRRSLGS